MAIEAGPARPLWRRVLPLAVLALGSLAIVASGVYRHLSLDQFVASRAALADWVDAHALAAVLGYIGLYAAAVALSVPGASLLTVAGGFLFGVAIGGSAAVIAATLGATAVFSVARSSVGGLLRDRAGPILRRVEDGFRKDAVSYLLFLRLVPAFPFWAVNLAPALFDVPLRTFVWTTFVGILPGTFAFSFAGAGIDSVVSSRKRAYEDCLASGAQGCDMHFGLQQLVTPQLLGALVALGVVALIPVALRRWRTASER